jgi:hypothetical protein
LLERIETNRRAEPLLRVRDRRTIARGPEIAEVGHLQEAVGLHLATLVARYLNGVKDRGRLCADRAYDSARRHSPAVGQTDLEWSGRSDAGLGHDLDAQAFGMPGCKLHQFGVTLAMLFGITVAIKLR